MIISLPDNHENKNVLCGFDSDPDFHFDSILNSFLSFFSDLDPNLALLTPQFCLKFSLLKCIQQEQSIYCSPNIHSIGISIYDYLPQVPPGPHKTTGKTGFANFFVFAKIFDHKVRKSRNFFFRYIRGFPYFLIMAFGCVSQTKYFFRLIVPIQSVRSIFELG